MLRRSTAASYPSKQLLGGYLATCWTAAARAIHRSQLPQERPAIHCALHRHRAAGHADLGPADSAVPRAGPQGAGTARASAPARPFGTAGALRPHDHLGRAGGCRQGGAGTKDFSSEGRLCLQRVSERDLNPHSRDLQLCSADHLTGRITVGQRLAYVSEGDSHLTDVHVIAGVWLSAASDERHAGAVRIGGPQLLRSPPAIRHVNRG